MLHATREPVAVPASSAVELTIKLSVPVNVLAMIATAFRGFFMPFQ